MKVGRAHLDTALERTNRRLDAERSRSAMLATKLRQCERDLEHARAFAKALLVVCRPTTDEVVKAALNVSQAMNTHP